MSLGLGRLIVDRICSLGNSAQEAVCLSEKPEEGARCVMLVGAAEPTLVVVDEHCVRISLHDAARIAEYGKIFEEEYAAIAVFVGVLFDQTILRNPNLAVEDIAHPYEKQCIFAGGLNLAHYAGPLESLEVCPKCIEFFDCLSTNLELDALRKVLDLVETNRIHRSLVRRSALSKDDSHN